MKKIFALIVLVLFFTGCQDDPNPCAGYGVECAATVESHWELVEVYSDPGNGGGSFNAVDSDRTITIFENGDFISKGSLCTFDINNTEIQTGEIEYGNSDTKFVFTDCTSNGNNQISERIFTIDGDEMIVDFVCFEGCSHKYKRVD